ncbi:MAG: ATP-dependent DNA helicase RecG [Patescibacteria group bacterium]|jgi:ATP-dependent DNA helicase RecG
MLDAGSGISNLSGVGEAAARELKKIGVEKIRDLLFYFPFRYDDFSRTVPIADLKIGENANIIGQIELINARRSPRRRAHITEALIRDKTGSLRAVWFNQPFIARQFSAGDTISIAGKASEDYGGMAMLSPFYEKAGAVIHSRDKIAEKKPSEGTHPYFHTRGLVPVYHLSGKLNQKRLRSLIGRVIYLAEKIPDWVPPEARGKKYLSLPEAIRLIHFPRNQKDAASAKKRLAFQELFLVQLRSQMARREMDLSLSHRLKFYEKETREFVFGLPFRLTDAQKKAAWEILRDLEKERPMARLLTGDVGSGKTIVAAIAILNAVLNGKQAVIMAPTEILAKQHFETFGKLFSGMDIKIGLVTSSEKKMNYESPARNEPRECGVHCGRIINNAADFDKTGGRKKKKPITHDSLFIIHNSQVIVGTHALIQENLHFNNLALAIIDEQHRFGVEQRKTLIEKATAMGIEKKFAPHFLSMTATPIPRSLALALYGELDVSIINEMPKGRKKVLTRVIPEEKREAAYEFIRKKAKEGRQVFVICPLIDPSDKLGVKSVKEEFEKLNQLVFPDLKVGLLHGRLKPREKDKVMEGFSSGKIKVLVSTSVVEVGIDIPNATVMMIEGADRFGLAQIHQFRGRVGRGREESFCFLFTDSAAEKTLARLKAVETESDGFKLARMDLELRGPGEVYGIAQKGFPELKIASLFDYELTREAKAAAEKIMRIDPSLSRWPLLKREIGEWEKSTHME